MRTDIKGEVTKNETIETKLNCDLCGKLVEHTGYVQEEGKTTKQWQTIFKSSGSHDDGYTDLTYYKYTNKEKDGKKFTESESCEIIACGPCFKNHIIPFVETFAQAKIVPQIEEWESGNCC